MRHRGQLEFLTTELKVKIMHRRVRLEAPGQRACEIITEALQAALMYE